MSLADKVWNKIDRYKEAVALANAEQENRDSGNNFPDNQNIIPGRYTGGREKTFVKEIKSTLTGEITAYEDEYGRWTIVEEAHNREFELSKQLGCGRQ